MWIYVDVLVLPNKLDLPNNGTSVFMQNVQSAKHMDNNSGIHVISDSTMNTQQPMIVATIFFLENIPTIETTSG